MSLIHEEEDWVAIYKRDTAGWAALHPLARFVSLELTRKLNRRGETSVGTQGLSALAALVGAPWEMIETHVHVLLEDGRLEYDAERRIVRDPQHAIRQEAARRAIGGQAASRRALSPAERAASSRARRKAERLEVAVETVTFVETVTPTVTASRDDRDDRDATAETVAVTEVSAPSRMEPVVTPEFSLSLSDLKISKKRERAAPSGDVVQRDATIPEDCRSAFESACCAKNVVLCADYVWKKFAGYASRKRWRTPDVRERWETWFEREITFTLDRTQQLPLRARDRPGPGLAATNRVLAERVQWEREAQSYARHELVAASARAMQVFA